MNPALSSVPAANPVLTPEVCPLIDLRGHDGALVRRVSIETAGRLIEAGLAEPVGLGHPGKYLRLRQGVDGGAALGLQRSSRTWAREQHQNSRVRHTSACNSFEPQRSQG
jgi:hypothetical protein